MKTPRKTPAHEQNPKVEQLLRFYAQESGTPYQDAKRELLAMDFKTQTAWLKSISEHQPKTV